MTYLIRPRPDFPLADEKKAFALLDEAKAEFAKGKSFRQR